MKGVSTYTASDYAGITFDDGSFYYGYEYSKCSECGAAGDCCEDHDADSIWYFRAEIHDGDKSQVTLIPHTDLLDDKFNVVSGLLAGIGRWMNHRGES